MELTFCAASEFVLKIPDLCQRELGCFGFALGVQ
jgi:hypothetical protein